jgi:hypothetical protein
LPIGSTAPGRSSLAASKKFRIQKILCQKKKKKNLELEKKKLAMVGTRNENGSEWRTVPPRSAAGPAAADHFVPGAGAPGGASCADLDAVLRAMDAATAGVERGARDVAAIRGEAEAELLDVLGGAAAELEGELRGMVREAAEDRTGPFEAWGT